MQSLDTYMSAIGKLLLLLNMAAAIAKLRCDLRNRSTVLTRKAMIAETPVTTTKRMGMIQSSFNLDGVSENATLEKRRHGVKSETLTRLSCFCVFLSSIPFLASSLQTAHRHSLKYDGVDWFHRSGHSFTIWDGG